jgi:hypothetical protein
MGQSAQYDILGQILRFCRITATALKVRDQRRPQLCDERCAVGDDGIGYRFRRHVSPTKQIGWL